MSQYRRLLVVALLLAAGSGYYYYTTRPALELVLTGVVTTNDVIVSPQVAGRLAELAVAEGDTVKRGQLIGVIAPEELKAESAYAAHNLEGLASQIQQSQAALRYEERQLTEQIRQAETNLTAAVAQQAASIADLEAARLTFERVRNLSRDGVAAAQELDQARTSYQAAEARLEALKKQADAQRVAVDLARTSAEQVDVRRSQVQTSQHLQAAAQAQQAKADARLAYTEMHAPIDGIVDVRAARLGEVLTVGQPVVSLVNPDDLWIRADVEETYIDRVRIGDHLRVRLPSGAELDGTVFYRGVDAAYATQRDVSRTKRDIKTFEIWIRCANTDRRLAVGMTAYVQLPLAPVAARTN
jgi:HlyD family secretion protein